MSSDDFGRGIREDGCVEYLLLALLRHPTTVTNIKIISQKQALGLDCLRPRPKSEMVVIEFAIEDST